jgi:hypothetical protein
MRGRRLTIRHIKLSYAVNTTGLCGCIPAQSDLPLGSESSGSIKEGKSLTS